MSVDGARLGVDRVRYGPPRVDIFLIAGDEQGVVETHEGARDAVAVLRFASDGVYRTEAPAIGAAPPSAVGPTRLAVKPHVARNHAAVLRHAREPRVHVVDDPSLVARFVREKIGVGRQHRRHEVDKMIADDLGVVAIVVEKLRVGALAVTKLEAVRVKRVADPIERRCRSQHRTITTVLQRADDFHGHVEFGAAGSSPR